VHGKGGHDIGVYLVACVFCIYCQPPCQVKEVSQGTGRSAGKHFLPKDLEAY